MLTIFSHYRYDLTVEEAIELGKRAITHAAHRDAMSGGMNNGNILSNDYCIMMIVIVYHVGEKGWTQVWRGDTNDMYYGYYPLKEKSEDAMET